MREIIFSHECLTFISSQGTRTEKKFLQIISVVRTRKVVHSKIIKKIKGTEFYELRLISKNQIRVIVFSIDHQNFNESMKCICLNGFKKKSNSDYKRAVQIARNLLTQHYEIL